MSLDDIHTLTVHLTTKITATSIHIHFCNHPRSKFSKTHIPIYSHLLGSHITCGTLPLHRLASTFLPREKKKMKNTNMVSSLGVLFTALIVLVAMNSSAGAATEFRVGDADGWRKPGVNETAMYEQWAKRNRFQVGDSLSFEYKNDSVLVVDKWDFYHCNSSSPISSFKNGKSVIKLERPGSFYFISGDPEHCKSGQRLVISVMALHPISQSPPAIALPPGNYFPISPSPSPLSSSGVLVSATLVPLLMAFIANLVGLV
ncbi:hypothetical protein VitviT2T_013377 [Vitis vinifera]|uniref:Phytocyanin domain-containing protein n=2 Tax=Vitis vinifera TaxID=29760 RepID=A0ABY9CGM1_VITVI|nr:early nodulin-like protein 7 [Vitis vinifera]WJZ94530.1 hypothetical protein VitviT2T_013377 [Vitis vinifera]|eukprot:XP_002284122.2 PREDICTED: early nodulin-like protein 1 [Vitis vinifera]